VYQTSTIKTAKALTFLIRQNRSSGRVGARPDSSLCQPFDQAEALRLFPSPSPNPIHHVERGIGEGLTSTVMPQRYSLFLLL